MEYQIGEFSKITRLTVKALRHYHEEGILTPSFVDPESNYRYYSDEQFIRADAIRTLRDLDFSIKEIGELLADVDAETDITEHLTKKLLETKEKITSYKKLERRLKEMLAFEEEREVNERVSDITVKELPQLQIASIRFTGTYSDVGKYAGPLFAKAARFATCKMLALYYDTEYKEDGADIEVAMGVRKPINDGDVHTRTLAGGKALTLQYRGPYEEISLGYRTLFDYVKETNGEMLVPLREVYIKGPGMIFRGNPKNYITEIQIPVQYK